MTDISFSCPQCSKSLVIDARGAGRTISCPDCGSQLEVPEPAEEEVIRLPPLEEPPKRKTERRDFRFRIPEQQPYEGKATQPQKHKIWELGFRDREIIDALGKAQAGSLIEQLMDRHFATWKRRKYLPTAILAGAAAWGCFYAVRSTTVPDVKILVGIFAWAFALIAVTALLKWGSVTRPRSS